DEAEAAHSRRADARRGCRSEGGDLRIDPRLGARGNRHSSHFIGAAGGVGAQLTDRSHAGGPGRGDADSRRSQRTCRDASRDRIHEPARGMTGRMKGAVALSVLLAFGASAQTPKTWTADNGNGTFSNPLFYDEFSDPDLIRVGDDYYLTGTTMHAMPGLPVLHSRDLVNWELMSYAVDRLDLGPRYRLEGGEIYGQGIWAPSFRYHNETFHIFTNVNGQTTQHFTATNPRGPWTRTAMKKSLHDLSVLFDDDGKVYVVWGYQDLHFAQLDSTLTDIVPGTERVLFAKDAGMGEGAHFYKIDGKYFIISAWYAQRMRLPAARADRPEGPYEVHKELSADETFGLREGYRV